MITKGGKHLVRSIKETDYEGLDLLPSDISYQHFSFALDKVKRSGQRLQESLAPLQALYTYIVLDCPPTPSLLAESILTAADHVLIPVVPTTLSMQAYAQLLAFSEDPHCGDRPITAFFSMVERSKSLHPTVMRETLGHAHRFLQSAKTYAALMTRWETFLNAEPSQPASETAPNAARPIRQLARQRLAKLSDRVVESGYLLLAEENDERLHKLRIDCKKLRYVLEFTSNLFPQSAVALALKHLRKLQDGLGHFHDCCTQQETFATYAEHFHAAEADATPQAIVHLIDVLEQEKQTCKTAFAERFTIFSASVEGKHRPWKRKR